jgi:hypothetical protein
MAEGAAEDRLRQHADVTAVLVSLLSLLSATHPAPISNPPATHQTATTACSALHAPLILYCLLRALCSLLQGYQHLRRRNLRHLVRHVAPGRTHEPTTQQCPHTV